MVLQKRIRLLETENKSLVSQLKRLQTILTGGGSTTTTTVPKTSAISAAANGTASVVAAAGANATAANVKDNSSNTAQPATCLLVLLLSFALFLLPNLKPDSGKSITDGSAAAKEMAQSLLKLPPFAGRSRALLQDTLALESDAELNEFDLELDEMDVGEEVVIGDDSDVEDTGLYMAVMPLGPPVGQGGGVAGLGGGNSLSKNQWEQKYGKQYPGYNGKRSVHAFLAEHDYHSYDPAAKRIRFKSKDEAAVPPAMTANVDATPSVIDSNQSTIYDKLITSEFNHHLSNQNPIVLRISEEL